MDLLLILTYVAICTVIFKVFRIPVNEWSLTTAGLGGVFLIAGLLLLMNYSHPATTIATTFYRTTPIISYLRAPIVEVPVQPNVRIEKGTPLLVLDDTEVQNRVQELEARKALVVADFDAKQEAVKEAQANVQAANAALQLAQTRRDDAATLVERDVASVASLEFRDRELETAQASLASAEAALRSAELDVGAQTASGQSAQIAEIESQLAQAKWELDQATIKAPADGYVTSLAVRPGFMARRIAPSMVFIEEQPNQVIASFLQVHMQRLQVGDEAEVAFLGIPGRIFKGKISAVIEYIPEGQVAPSGEIISPEDRGDPGRMNVIIDLDEDMREYALPGGSYGQVAVYTDYFHHVSIIRKVLLRMQSWLHYLSFDH
ncbi:MULTISPECIES: HlyD family secretion protein [Pseudovibrio]|uniref:HlyD family secretion protein n=1 Tax=Stappiaceae TaxID=2821832 RepID=UPI0023664DE8|nr:MULTISPECIES: efflux RND transporter periplasmic adaptor subunit [Pseudovibrio]MDD7909555.1 efflux RND transporter periplasmic adaptor subunit [Pseudovibrio exalbescens]MDX5595092.1 efflux RND transporter periplasmic adaptor subunit [Pseudovibrio sp. SPO723]